MNGNKVIIQYGLESTYGTIGTATKQIQVSSEGFKLNLNKIGEGLLTGAKIGGKLRTMSRSGEGALSSLARPDDIGLFLAVAVGNEETPVLVDGSTGAYEHTFTLTDANILDSLFFKVKRDDAIIKGYTGLTFDGFSFNSASEDMLKMDFTLKGKDEIDTTLETGLSVSPLAPFRFAGTTVSVAGTALEVVSTKFDFKNNLDANTQTNKSGLYFKQPEIGMIDISTEMECVYDSVSNGIRNSYWLTDNVCSVDIKYLNGDEVESGFPYSLQITLPANQVQEATPNVSGAERIKFPLKLKAVENGVEPITITLINGFAGTYLS